MDVYGTVLRSVLFPAWERLRGRPTVPLVEYMRRSERASRDELEDLRAGLLRRLLRHAVRHTAYYRARFAALGIAPEDLAGSEDVIRLPLLERADAQGSLESRTADAPPRVAVEKGSSGTTGQPMIVRYNAESRHWRDAARWRGYGWAGYRYGDRALHFWGSAAIPPGRLDRWKIEVDHALRRDTYIDCGKRDDDHLATVVAAIRRIRPRAILAYSQAGAELARFVNRTGARTWDTIPVICGAERVFPADREAMIAAFGPAVFETYGCREFMLMGSECEHHDGLHETMENLIVEIVVREPGGGLRPARPGEQGEVVVTDLHNLACPLIRYVTGDLAVARADTPCACGRTLRRFGPVEGRVVDTLRDADGAPVNGLTFNILMVSLGDKVKQFQAHQAADNHITLRLVPKDGVLDPGIERVARDFVGKYMKGVPLTIEVVPEIPLTAAGKRRYVIVDKPGPATSAPAVAEVRG
jgi:phenylacetate-CoA ligase